MTAYSSQHLVLIYELGRLYYEMGYLSPAERVFQGIIAADSSFYPAYLGLGLIRLERGQCSEAGIYFREALKSKIYQREAKLGLSLAFISAGEGPRAKVLLNQMVQELEKQPIMDPTLKDLRDALALLC